MIIYGAGMAGLIAATMLRRYKPTVYEAQASLPQNHDAVLRFRSPAVSEATGIPFRKVRVTKSIYWEGEHYHQTNPKFNNLYSHKVTGRYMDRSITDMEPAIRYIAPPDFVKQLADHCAIEYGVALNNLDGMQHNAGRSYLGVAAVSTIPMPVMMQLAGRPLQTFQYTAISVGIADITAPATDLYQTVYFPNPENGCYRASITGNRLIAEFVPSAYPVHADMTFIANVFGLRAAHLEGTKFKAQKFGKICPIDESIRRRFILYLTDTYGIYSLGRFATWRQILLDDIVQDVQRIEQLINDKDGYSARFNSPA